LATWDNPTTVPAGASAWNVSGTNISSSNSGNVGIGIATPITKLDVYDASSANSLLAVRNNDGIFNVHPYSAGYTQIAAYKNSGSLNSYVGLRIVGWGFNSAIPTLNLVTNNLVINNTIDGNPSGTQVTIPGTSAKLGIGTTTPTSKLHVSGTTNVDIRLEDKQVAGADWRIIPQTGNTTKLFRIFDNANSVDRLVINSSGNVGIGTTDPSSKLVLSDDVTSPRLRFLTTLTSDTYSGIEFYSPLGWKGGLLRHNSNDDMTIWTADGNNPRMTIKHSTGNVGIGTTTPGAKLHLYEPNDSIGTTALIVEANGPQGGTRGFVRANTGTAFEIGTENSARLGLFSANIERLTIDTAGKVGIGVTNPSYGLQVNGSFAATYKNFDIPHPLDPANKRLVHSSIEGPEHAVYYRGVASLSSGTAEITLPDYFEALTRKERRTILLTNVDGFDKLAVKTQAGEQVQNGRFIVFSDNPASIQKFNWEVKAVRADVEPLKSVK
jgi:hypothetical protein